MRYFLGDACKNVFVLFDCLEMKSVDESFLKKAHQCLKQEQKDDALILVNGHVKDGAFYAEMMVLGEDGLLAEFCGNGSRVCAAYLFKNYPSFKNIYLITRCGKHLLKQYGNDIYSITLSKVSFDLHTKFIGNLEKFKTEYSLTYVEAIEPHVVVKGNLSDDELFDLGRFLNSKKDIFPFGINVNSCNVEQENRLFVKTYERGVQRLTMSCGSGSISSAATYTSNGSVLVSTKGGLLEVSFSKDSIELKGPAFYFCKNKTEQ